MLQGLADVCVNNDQLLQHVSFFGPGLVWGSLSEGARDWEREAEGEEEEHVIENDGELQRHGLRYKACHCPRASDWLAQ